MKIEGPDFFIFRAIGISTSPWAICLGLLCYVVSGCVDLMVQNNTGTRMVSISRKGVVTKRAIAPCTKDGLSKELTAFERHFYPCSGYCKEGVAVRPTTSIENPKTGKALLNRPLNVTTSYLLDIMKEAAFTSFHEIESLKQEMYGANSKE